jgi:hypothetical protein
MNKKDIRKLVRKTLKEEFKNEGLGSWASKQKVTAKKKSKEIKQAFNREKKETRIAAKILLKLIKTKEATPEEIKFLKGQSADLGKAFTLLGLQAVPGATLIIAGLEKLLRKYDLTIFPQAQEIPDSFEEKEKAEN